MQVSERWDEEVISFNVSGSPRSQVAVSQEVVGGTFCHSVKQTGGNRSHEWDNVYIYICLTVADCDVVTV